MQSTARAGAAQQRRNRGGAGELLIALGFLLAYGGLAQSMEGLNFDTIFIAMFCTFLSSFIVRCFVAFAKGRG